MLYGLSEQTGFCGLRMAKLSRLCGRAARAIACGVCLLTKRSTPEPPAPPKHAIKSKFMQKASKVAQGQNVQISEDIDVGHQVNGESDDGTINTLLHCSQGQSTILYWPKS
jgi:hypothetical protein